MSESNRSFGIQDNELSFTKRKGATLTRFTLGIGTACVFVGMFSTAIWDASKYDSRASDADTRLHLLETQMTASVSTASVFQNQIATESDHLALANNRITSLEQNFNALQARVQKLEEDNARLQERVIFLIAQVEGRMPVDHPRTPK